MPDFSGQSIGRYQIIEPLGQGGMATVYRAFDTRLECDVAVKFIRMELLSPVDVERTLKRFEREAKEVARLTHPNIVRVIDYGEYNGTPYLVMPYLPGGSLKELAGKPMQYEQAARLLAPVARALEYAHEKNLIHRDIKPGNILLTDRGQPMVSDFGIAKILDVEGGHTLTSTNVAIGTPEYMAPEQWFNQVGAQSDIYSLGVVFYELVTGHKPYTADTPAAIFLKQTNDPLPRPRSFMPDLPEAVEQVLYKALAKKPEERYAGMGEFAAALEELATPAKAPPLPQPQIIAPVPEPERSPAPPPTPPQAEAFQIEETGPGMPVSPPVSKNETPPVDSGIIPAGLPVKAAPTRLPVSRWVWGTVGIIALVGLVALAGWGIGKYNSSLAATQTVPVQIALPMTDTPAPPTSTKPATSTRPLLPVDTGPTLTAWPTITLSPTPGQIKAPAATRVSGLGIGSTQISPKDGMMQVYVPAGEFLMGSDKTKDSQAFDNELPQHTVYLDAFWIDQTEVTNAEYAGCAASGQCTPPHETSSSNRSSYYGNSQFDSYPVINMDWSQATAYCAWAGRRLPSEAEWEKAARGTDSRIYPWGNDISCNQSNYWGKDGGCKGDTSRVGSYPSGASPYGALDMAGNVWEWVNDWFGSSYYQNSPARNPGGPDSGTSHVLRGGSWNINVRLVRSAYRSDYAPVNRLYFIGFRCAASP